MTTKSTPPAERLAEATGSASYEEIGRQLMEGIINTAGKWLILGMAVVGGWGILQNIFGWGLDSTDAGPWKRSGMRLYTDEGTGVQYLSDGNSLTPRLNPNGTVKTK